MFDRSGCTDILIKSMKVYMYTNEKVKNCYCIYFYTITAVNMGMYSSFSYSVNHTRVLFV